MSHTVTRADQTSNPCPLPTIVERYEELEPELDSDGEFYFKPDTMVGDHKLTMSYDGTCVSQQYATHDDGYAQVLDSTSGKHILGVDGCVLLEVV